MKVLAIYTCFELLLLTTILVIFMTKLMIVSFYQERTGEYFDNKIIFLYTKKEIQEANTEKGRKAMLRANILSFVLRGLVIALLLLISLE